MTDDNAALTATEAASAGKRLQSRLIVAESGCWEWPGAKNAGGYGVLGIGRRTELAHRVALTLWLGRPAGPVVRHKECDNPACCNPLHLAGGSHADNVGDKVAKGRQTKGPTHPNTQKTHCPRGHEYTPQNTYVYPNQYGGVRRSCKACMRSNETKRRKRT